MKKHPLVALLQNQFIINSDLDPRSPISVSIISFDITLPPVISGARLKVSLKSLVKRVLEFSRSLLFYRTINQVS